MLIQKPDHDLNEDEKCGYTDQEENDLKLYAEIICNLLFKKFEQEAYEQEDEAV